MTDQRKRLTAAELAQRAKDLEVAAAAAAEAGDELAEAAEHLDLAANSLWAWERSGRWPRTYRSWQLAVASLHSLRAAFPKAGTLKALHLLLDDEDWSHPSQVLERPRPDYRELAELAKARHKNARGDRRERLAEVVKKLERAANFEESAQKRREDRRRRKRKKST